MSYFVIIILAIVIIVPFFCRQKKIIKGQLAVVTGGATGIGKQIALCLAKKGCNVVIADIDNENAQKTKEEIENEFPEVKIKAYKVDVSNESEVIELKEKVETELGNNVDIVINNAAILFEAPLLEERPEHFERMMRVNVLSIVWTTRTFLPAMISNKRGHLVTLASLAGVTGVPQMLVYSTSKFAVRGFMETLGLELYLEGHSKYIKTTTIYPFFVNSNENLKSFIKNYWKLPDIGLLKVQKPEDVAKRIVKAIEYEEETVTIPGFNKVLGYFLTMPLFLRRFVFNHVVKQ